MNRSESEAVVFQPQQAASQPASAKSQSSGQMRTVSNLTVYTEAVVSQPQQAASQPAIAKSQSSGQLRRDSRSDLPNSDSEEKSMLEASVSQPQQAASQPAMAKS